MAKYSNDTHVTYYFIRILAKANTPTYTSQANIFGTHQKEVDKPNSSVK